MLGMPSVGLPNPRLLSSMTDDLVLAGSGSLSSGATATHVGANAAVLVPVRLDQTRTFVRAWWWNGSAVAGNVDAGLYTVSGTTATRIVASTAEAQAGTNTIQVAGTFTTTTVAAGLYWIAMSCSNSATAQFWRTSIVAQVTRTLMCFTNAAAHPLPSTLTVAAYSVAILPVFGLSEYTTV